MIPDRLFDTFTPEEAAFQCEDEIISIIPRQTMRPILLAGWQLQGMRPLQETKVPLWVALLLKKQGRCKIRFPDWLDETRLKSFVDAERSQAEFSKLPWSWQPLARILLDEAADDLNGDIDIVREYIKDLTEVRQVKIRAGVTQALNENHISMDGMGILELNEVRPLLVKGMHALKQLGEVER